MAYTETQIDNAKKSYTAFMQFRTVASYDPQYIGQGEAEQRAEHHNKVVKAVQGGDKELEKEWKLFFLNEELKADYQADQKKAKLAANKDASADILAPIKESKRIVEFGKWLNTPGNPFRKEHFSKKYTLASVNAFLTK